MQTRVSTRGLIKIPAPILRELGICAGDLLDITVENGRIVLTPQKKTLLESKIVEVK
jgi:AbrB family looped-hinge helix DNA binding protein